MKFMNINQIGVNNQGSEKSNKVSTKFFGIAEPAKSSYIKVGQSRIQNALASSSNTYGKTSEAEDSKSVAEDQKKKNTTEYFDDITGRMTADDAKDMEEEGMTLEKYNMERLDRTLNRIKKQKQFKREAMESSTEKRKQMSEDTQKAAVHAAMNGGNSSQVVTALENANLPVTEENISKISQALSMSESVTSLSEEGLSYMIFNNVEPTIFQFYQAEHVGKSTEVTQGSDNVGAYEAVNVAYDISDAVSMSKANEADWEQLERQAAKVVEAAGLEVSDDIMNSCKWLFSQDLPITEESIKGLLEIQDIQENFDLNDLTDEIIKQYEQGTEPEHTDLRSLNKTYSAEDLQKFLQDVENQLSEHNLEVQNVTLHRQLEEVRLKMTTEAGQQLKDMGIEVDIAHIEDVINGLKEIENSYYRNLFAEAGVEASAEQTELMKQTTQAVDALASMPVNILGKTFDTRSEETLNSLAEAGNELKNQLEKAGEAYETLGTEVRKDLGDSIKKAFQNISSILEDLGMEPTEANTRAVKILGYNNIEITEQSVNEMKYYDKQVRDLMDGLKPAVTLEMIKSGQNPLDTPIEEVNQAIEDIQKEIGITEDEKYSEFLWRLDQSDSITKDERKAYIGMYRMLSQIEKSDGAAIGSVIKAGKDLTLDNLMTAVKTKKSGGIDVTVDESFGEIEELNQNGETVQEQVEYYRRLSRTVLENAAPEDFADGTVSLEKLSEMVQEDQGENHSDYVKEKYEQFLETVQNPEECIAFLEANSQEVTMETMMAAEQILNNGSWNQFYKKLDGKDRETFTSEADELMDKMDEDSFGEAYSEFTDKVQDIVQDVKRNDTDSFVDVSLLKLVGSSLQLTGSLSRQENYNIPMLMGDQIGNVNVTVQHKDETGGKVEISYSSPVMGEVQAQLAVKDGEIKGFITTDNQPGLEMIRSEKDAMTNGFEALGFQVKQVDYSIFSNNRLNRMTGTEAGDISTKQLLQTAKVFIGTLSAIERREG